MKKTLLLLASAALLLVGCAKEQLSNGLEGELTKVTFTANLDNGVATKAAVDGDGAAANVNRCIMEIYYGDALFTRQITKVTDKKATFPVQVVSNRTYTVAFWADKVDDAVDSLATDKYYITNAEGLGLKAVALNGAYIGNDDARDAFAYSGKYTIEQTGSAFTAVLKRPFAQINVITTDVDTVAKVSALKPEKVNVILKNAAQKYNVLDSTAVTGSAGNLTYTADIYKWDATKTECTLSMDYIFAEKEKGVIDIDWKAKKTGDADVEHAFAAVPYQRNYRTNIKGALLTTQGQWTVTVDPIWGSPEYDVPFLSASTIAEAQSYIAPETQGSQTSKVVDLSKATITTEDFPGADKKIEFMLKTTSPADMVNFTLPAIPAEVITAGCTGWKITHQTGYPTQNVNVTAPTGTSVTIDAPRSHVTLNGVEYDQVTATTGYGTLVVPQGVTINNLTVKKGWVEIHGTVNTLNDIAPAAGDSVYFRDCEGLSQTVFAQIKGNDFSFIHPDYVKKQNGDKWDIIPVAIPVTGVSLSLDKVTLNVDENKSLTATVLPEDASNTNVVWTSSNTGVVTVDHAGNVTAVAEGSANIIVTTVNQSKTDTCSVTVKKIPAGALGGEFSVSDTKTVHFSQGNLWYGPVTEGAPATFNFEANQYDFRTYPGKGSCINGTYNKNSGTLSGHYGLFTWSSTADAVGNSISGNNLFTNDPIDEEKANSDFKVKVGDIEQSGWRTLTTVEWRYLFNYGSYTSEVRNGKYKAGVTVCGSKNCIVIAPDDWDLTAHPLQSSYGTDSSEGNPMTWEQAEAKGLVCLPAAGYRDGSNVGSVGDGKYCSSTALDESSAYGVGFDSLGVSPGGYYTRSHGYSVRLITDVK